MRVLRVVVLMMLVTCLTLALGGCAEKPNPEATLENLNAHLLERGVVVGEKTETYAVMIGAIDGFKYLDSDVEVYEFDPKSEAFAVAIDDGGTMGVASAVNGKFVLWCERSPNKDVIVAAFNEFK